MVKLMNFDSSCGFLFYLLHYYGGCQYVQCTKKCVLLNLVVYIVHCILNLKFAAILHTSLSHHVGLRHGARGKQEHKAQKKVFVEVQASICSKYSQPDAVFT